MSLDDKFYPDDGKPLTKFDNFMIKSVGKLGELYQNITGRSYKDLVNASYKVSAGGFAASLAFMRVSSLLFGYLSLNRTQCPDYKSPIEEEIESEVHGYPKSFGKFFRTALLFWVPFTISQSNDMMEKGVEKDSFISKYLAIGGAIEGASLVPYNFAEYLSKAQVPKPPKKTWGKRLKEYFKENLSPRPIPVPVKYLSNQPTS